MTLRAVWVDGRLQPEAGAHVSAFDRGFTLADGLFETMLARRGIAFRLDRHLARLTQGLDALQIPSPPALRAWILDALRAAGHADLSVRVTVTRGSGGSGVAPPSDPRPTVVVSVGPLPDFPAATYQEGLTAHIASGRRNERAMTLGLKTLAYAEAVVALMEARKADADEALFLDTEGHCSEATSSNLFVCTDRVLVTPPVSCGALPGITRATVMELAADLRIDCAERVLTVDELKTADEAFLTSSLRGIAPLARVDDAAVGGATPGPLTRRLASAYAALVARECRSQS